MSKVIRISPATWARMAAVGDHDPLTMTDQQARDVIDLLLHHSSAADRAFDEQADLILAEQQAELRADDFADYVGQLARENGWETLPDEEQLAAWERSGRSYSF